MAGKHRCLMIGAGGMATWWVRSFFPPFAERMAVVGLADIDPDPLQAQGDFLGLSPERRFTSMEAAFTAIEADFCAICIPPAYHREAVLRAVESGMQILSEKPIADTWEACLDIYRAVTTAGAKMSVVQNYRYTPRILTFRQALTEGRVGRLNYLIGRFADDYRSRNAWGKFRHEIPHSLLVEGAIHHFDQLRNLSGSDCRTIAGREWNPGHPSFDGECCGLYMMEMANDVRALYEGNCLEAGWQNGWHREYYRAECESGAIILDRDGTVRVLEHTPGRGLKTEERPAIAPKYDGHCYLVNEFLDWLGGGPEPATVIDDNMKSAAMLFAAIEASETQSVVDVQAKVAKATAGG